LRFSATTFAPNRNISQIKPGVFDGICGWAGKVSPDKIMKAKETVGLIKNGEIIGWYDQEIFKKRNRVRETRNTQSVSGNTQSVSGNALSKVKLSKVKKSKVKAGDFSFLTSEWNDLCLQEFVLIFRQLLTNEFVKRGKRTLLPNLLHPFLSASRRIFNGCLRNMALRKTIYDKNLILTV